MCLAVTSPAISFRELEVPAAKPRDLDRILAGEAAHLSASKQESLMDYVLLGSTEREGKQFFRAWCAVVPRSLVDGYRDAVRKAGFRPEAFDVACNAAFKACRLDRDLPKEETVIYAGVREDELCLSLFGGGGTRLYREAQVAAPKSRWRTNTSSPRSCPRRRTPKAARSGWPARRRPSFPASFSSS